MGDTRKAGVNQLVWEYLKNHTGEVTFAADIAKMYDLNTGSVQTALARFHATQEWHVKRVSRGAYVYLPNNGTIQEEKPHGQTLKEYPPVLKGVEKEKHVHSTHGTPRFDVMELSTDPNRPEFRFVGFMGDMPILRDKAQSLWAAMPLQKLIPKPGQMG